MYQDTRKIYLDNQRALEQARKLDNNITEKQKVRVVEKVKNVPAIISKPKQERIKINM